MVLVTLFSAGGCSLADVFAWMSDNGLSSPIDITSNVHKTYFNGGDGSEGDPYQIDNALQLYYFAWLQDLGLFNVDSDDEGTQIDTVYFVLTSNINMKDDLWPHKKMIFYTNFYTNKKNNMIYYIRSFYPYN